MNGSATGARARPQPWWPDVGLSGLVSYVWNHPLNSSGRIAALGRVARWQMASRLMSGPIALPFVEDTSLFVSRGMTGATGNWYCGLHEARDMAFVLHVLRRADHFLDIGANVGSYTVLAAGAVGARVTSLEPIPTTFAHLRRNVVLNGLSARVRARQCGASDSAGTLRFSTGHDTANYVLVEGSPEPGVEVPVRTVDEVVGQRIPALIKIDVEGYERRVVGGATRTLADPHVLAVVMETNGSGARYGVADAELLAIMDRHGFSACTYDPFARRLLDRDPAAGNTIFVRDTQAVDARLRSARRYRLVNRDI
jgi:FkbM family methyltransferase